MRGHYRAMLVTNACAGSSDAVALPQMLWS